MSHRVTIDKGKNMRMRCINVCVPLTVSILYCIAANALVIPKMIIGAPWAHKNTETRAT